LYLKRLKKKNEISVLLYRQKDTGVMGYALTFHF
jgi:hypothetical protein